MKIIRPAFDCLLIISSTYVLIRCTNRLLMKPGAFLGNYVILIVWVFCVLPILLDYLVGRPTFQTVYWYQHFIKPTEDNEVSSIYDILIFVSMYALYFFSNSHESKGKATEVAVWNTALAEYKPQVFLVVVLPFLNISAIGHSLYLLMSTYPLLMFLFAVQALPGMFVRNGYKLCNIKRTQGSKCPRLLSPILLFMDTLLLPCDFSRGGASA